MRLPVDLLLRHLLLLGFLPPAVILGGPTPLLRSNLGDVAIPRAAIVLRGIIVDPRLDVFDARLEVVPARGITRNLGEGTINDSSADTCQQLTHASVVRPFHHVGLDASTLADDDIALVIDLLMVLRVHLEVKAFLLAFVAQLGHLGIKLFQTERGDVSPKDSAMHVPEGGTSAQHT